MTRRSMHSSEAQLNQRRAVVLSHEGSTRITELTRGAVALS